MPKKLTYNGETLPISAWARRLGLDAPTLHHRLKSGWSVEKVVTTPKQGNKAAGACGLRVEFRGESLTARQWAARFGWPEYLVTGRLAQGWSVERTLTTPARTLATVEHEGRAITYAEAVVLCGVTRQILHRRVSQGWSLQDIKRSYAMRRKYSRPRVRLDEQRPGRSQ